MTDTNKVKPMVGTIITDRRDSDIYGAGFEEGKRITASALAALKQQLDATSDAYNAMVPSLQEQRDTLRTQLAEAQAEAASYRSALVGMMACTLRADCPPDIYDAARAALKGDV